MTDDVRSLIDRSGEARRARDHATALSLAESAAESARSINDRSGLGAALAALGRLRRDERELDEALKLYEEAASIARERGDGGALAHRLRHIGDIAMERRDLARAEDCYDEAGGLFDRQSTGELERANLLRSKALLKEKQGANEAAAQYWTQARALYLATGIADGVKESDRRLALLKG
jgi:tetratricopeptide (TPR) repeat protein